MKKTLLVGLAGMLLPGVMVIFAIGMVLFASIVVICISIFLLVEYFTSHLSHGVKHETF